MADCCPSAANTSGNAVSAFTLGSQFRTSGAGRDLVRGGVALRLAPVVGIPNLAGVGGGGQDLRHQRVRIKRDRGHELFQLSRVERLGRSLAVTLLRIRRAGILIRLLRVRLLSIVRLLR